MPAPEFIPISVKSVLNRVQGMPFRWSINPYRGCSHGCVFCYARRTHWFLDRDGVNEWSSKIYVKLNAPEVLRRELARSSWQREVVALGTATDPYQAAEGKYRITRGILLALRDYRTPVSMITRSPMIVRDADLLCELARVTEVTVCFSIATVDAALGREIEPTVAPPLKRLKAMQHLGERGIRVGVLLAPVLPGLTDNADSIAGVLQAAKEHGAEFVWHNVLHLGEVTKDAFAGFLRNRHPELIALYQVLYHGKYAPKQYQDRVERLFQEQIRGFSFQERYREPAPKLEQLSLL